MTMYYLYYMTNELNHTNMKATQKIQIRFSDNTTTVIEVPMSEVYLAAGTCTGYRQSDVNLELCEMAARKRGYYPSGITAL